MLYIEWNTNFTDTQNVIFEGLNIDPINSLGYSAFYNKNLILFRFTTYSKSCCLVLRWSLGLEHSYSENPYLYDALLTVKKH